MITPKTNTTLFGHASAQEQFLSEFASGKLAHGWIFGGAKGIGKATLAYHFARQLLSHSPDDTLTASRIAAGSHSDLLVIEPEYDPKKDELAREISVEQARSVAGFLSLTPGEGQWRIVIIDSADALNTAGANAILKILEEPPPQAVLMLIAHNPGRLLPTIRSRCRMLRLTPLSSDDFTRTVRHIAPETDGADMRALKLLSGGAPGLALELQSLGALALYADMLDMLETLPVLDTGRLQRFAEQIGTGQVHTNWQIFTQLMLCLLERTAKTASAILPDEIFDNEQAVLTALARLHPAHIWAEKWQQCADQFSLAAARHLDYKQMVITFVHSIATTEGFQLGNAAA